MHSKTRRRLVEQFADDRRALARLLATERLQPFLGVELTLHQLKTVLLITTGAASTGSQLADTLHVSAPTVSAGVDRLVELGYITRSDAGRDRRVKTLIPTEKAQRLHAEFFDDREESSQILSTLALDDLAALVRGTGALRRALERRSHDPATRRAGGSRDTDADTP